MNVVPVTYFKLTAVAAIMAMLVAGAQFINTAAAAEGQAEKVSDFAVFVGGDVAEISRHAPNGMVLTIKSINSTADKTRITLARDASADEWTIETPAAFPLHRGLIVGESATLLPINTEQGDVVLGYALTAAGEFLLYVSTQQLPLYSRRIDG